MWPRRVWPVEATLWGVGCARQEPVLRCSWITLGGLTPASHVSLAAIKNSLGRPCVPVVRWRLGFRNVRFVLLGALPILSACKPVRFVALVAFNGPRVARLNSTEVRNGLRLKVQCQKTTAIVFLVIFWTRTKPVANALKEPHVRAPTKWSCCPDISPLPLIPGPFTGVIPRP